MLIIPLRGWTKQLADNQKFRAKFCVCVYCRYRSTHGSNKELFTPGPRRVGPALSSLAGIMVSVNASHPPQPAQLLASLACRGVALVWENATSLPRPRTQWAEAAKTTFPYAQNPNLRDSYKEQTGKTCHFLSCSFDSIWFCVWFAMQAIHTVNAS